MMRADSIISNMDDAAEVPTSASRGVFLQALEERDNELSALLTQYSYKIMDILAAKRDLRKQYNAVAPNITTGMPEFPREGRAHGNIRGVLPITGILCY